MKIIKDEKLGQFRLMQVDGEIPSVYSCFLIDGKAFEPVNMHNMPQYIAIESVESHLNQDLQFVLNAELINDGDNI